MKVASVLVASTLLGGVRGVHYAGQVRLRGSSSLEAGGEGNASKDISYGTSGCPCIGIQGLEGEFILPIEGDPTHYPVEVGSYCNAWDNERVKACTGDGKDKGFCAKNWCWVDACNCNTAGSPPRLAQAGIASQGKPLYYSYDTCGDRDLWTEDHNPGACVNAKTEEPCLSQNDGNCIWGKTQYGDEPRCVGWEASGMCPDTPDSPTHWGHQDCPCIGFIGVEGHLDTLTPDGRAINYSASVGSLCKPWDAPTHPDCNGKKQEPWCREPWCLVDSGNCEQKPYISASFSNAEFQGRPVLVSYATCGGKTPAPQTKPSTTIAAAPTEATTTTAPAEATTAAPAATTSEPAPCSSSSAAATKSTTGDSQQQEKDDDATAAESGRDSNDDPVDKAEEGSGDGKKAESKPSKAEQQAGSITPSPMYNHDAYGSDWGDEWTHGRAPTWKELHPEAAAAVAKR